MGIYSKLYSLLSTLSIKGIYTGILFCVILANGYYAHCHNKVVTLCNSYVAVAGFCVIADQGSILRCVSIYLTSHKKLTFPSHKWETMTASTVIGAKM